MPGRRFLHNMIVGSSGGYDINWMVQAGGAGGGRTGGYGANSAGGGAGGFRSSVTN